MGVNATVCEFFGHRYRVITLRVASLNYLANPLFAREGERNGPQE
tara:strand:+ start:731 stop:865 length:135 start_codon:yes stop_codon:yes gene_type:complete